MAASRSSGLERFPIQFPALVARKKLEALGEFRSQLALTFFDRIGEVFCGGESLCRCGAKIRELSDDGELDFRVAEITENVLQLFELADESTDGYQGIQIGEELEEVAQFLGVDSEPVEEAG